MNLYTDNCLPDMKMKIAPVLVPADMTSDLVPEAKSGKTQGLVICLQ